MATTVASFSAANLPNETIHVPITKLSERRDTPAWKSSKIFRRGVNLGNWLEAEKSWAVTIDDREFAVIRREGFDHVRIPVAWHRHAGTGPDFKLSAEFFSRVDAAITNALKNGLAVIINIHHFDAMDQDPTGTTEQFIKLWEQVAEHYSRYPDKLVFELVNEPHANATTALMNPIYSKTIAVIRRTNPHRTLFVEPGGWGNANELKNLVLPSDDNLIVSIHCYEPFYFTHQGATWAGPDPRQIGIRFPGPPEMPLVPDKKLGLKKHVLDWIWSYSNLPPGKNPCGPEAFEQVLKTAKDWSELTGLPVHIGEFGAIKHADPKSRANYYSAFRRAAEKNDMGWCIWDWSAVFHYWDAKTEAPLPGMREALFSE